MLKFTKVMLNLNQKSERCAKICKKFIINMHKKLEIEQVIIVYLYKIKDVPLF
ncbi:hypothetical protein CCDG5_1328 [[Clostridium] cellulosi]|uniref:Uncharacterized protein n=1 Tax=[Clostridium] cellulosi TaxID=29343 RepID=A0A078KPJ9_9FIRM|nr:hypothetical protein CCDG5_1328 [[Clostridium] cellulosi]